MKRCWIELTNAIDDEVSIDDRSFLPMIDSDTITPCTFGGRDPIGRIFDDEAF